MLLMIDSKLSSDLLRGHTDTIILGLLTDGDKYGYEITKLVHEHSGKLYELKEATMYSSLKRLEKDGHITSYWGDETQQRRQNIIVLPKVAESCTQVINKTGIMPSKFWTSYFKERNDMEKKLQQFLDKAFAPYGEFPSRADVTKELLANLVEKYNDLKKQGMDDDNAYQTTVDSFGDVEEIMQQIPHAEKKSGIKQEEEPSLRKTLKMTFRQAKAGMGLSKFAAKNLPQADLSDTDLSESDFSYSALAQTNFAGSNLSEAAFRAAALKEASFANANLTNAVFAASDLQDADFKGANLTGVKFRASALRGASFDGAILVDTYFHYSDLAGVSFDDQELRRHFQL